MPFHVEPWGNSGENPMGNPTLNLPAEEPTPCWTCAHFGGNVHSAQPALICDCADRAGNFYGDPAAGCRHWKRGERAAGARIIVCGGRDFVDRERAFAALDAAHAKRPIGTVVQGGAAGADLLAQQWAKARGVLREEFPARWQEHGRAAGPIRNQAMADAGADGCIAFPGGRGTRDMTTRAELAGIAVWRPFG